MADRPVRVLPTNEDERSARQQAVVDDLVVGPTVNIYTTLVHHPEAAAAMVNLGRTLRRDVLPPRDREILILRTGCNCGSAYELAQHQRVALGLGMSLEDMERIAAGPAADGWDPFEAALCRACDELHSEHTISDGTWSQLSERYDTIQLIHAVMLIGYYHLVSFSLNALGVPLEKGARRFLEGPQP